MCIFPGFVTKHSLLLPEKAILFGEIVSGKKEATEKGKAMTQAHIPSSDPCVGAFRGAKAEHTPTRHKTHASN